MGITPFYRLTLRPIHGRLINMYYLYLSYYLHFAHFLKTLLEYQYE